MCNRKIKKQLLRKYDACILSIFIQNLASKEDYDYFLLLISEIQVEEPNL